MRELLTAEGYEQTTEKLRDPEARLAKIERRTDLTSQHLASVRRSYHTIMRELHEDLRLYESRHSKQPDKVAET